MSRAGIGRVVTAVVAAYLANAALVVASEELLSRAFPGVGSAPPLGYFVADLVSQCAYTIVAGYLCCAIAGPSRRAAMAGLIVLAALVGALSLALSWRAEPHWYGIALFAVFPPCVWIGWTLRARTTNASR
jgi:hypothetical protein